MKESRNALWLVRKEIRDVLRLFRKEIRDLLRLVRKRKWGRAVAPPKKCKNEEMKSSINECI